MDVRVASAALTFRGAPFRGPVPEPPIRGDPPPIATPLLVAGSSDCARPGELLLRHANPVVGAGSRRGGRSWGRGGPEVVCSCSRRRRAPGAAHRETASCFPRPPRARVCFATRPRVGSRTADLSSDQTCTRICVSEFEDGGPRGTCATHASRQGISGSPAARVHPRLAGSARRASRGRTAVLLPPRASGCVAIKSRCSTSRDRRRRQHLRREALFLAGVVRPQRVRSHAPRVRGDRGSLQRVSAAFDRGPAASSTATRGARGRDGEYQSERRVYARRGEPCSTCATPIARVVLGARGTHYCPRCQR